MGLGDGEFGGSCICSVFDSEANIEPESPLAADSSRLVKQLLRLICSFPELELVRS